MDMGVQLANLSVAELLSRWPETAHVFNQEQMACVGCVMARFETLREAALHYDLPLERLNSAMMLVVNTLAPEDGR